MNIYRSTLLAKLFVSISLASFAQNESDPAVTNRSLAPAPLASVGSPFSMTFVIGNNGTIPISGVGAANKMQWSICLGKCVPTTADPIASLSGDLLTYFNVSYTPPGDDSQGGCFEAVQITNVSLGPNALYPVVISAVVTKASTTTTVDDIGASCNIAPNPTANPQPTSNDFASIYTHTTTLALPIALVDFSAQAQKDRTVVVNWKTAWEKTNQGYVVERSKDLKQFEAVGEVKDVAGSSNTLSSYRFVDPQPYRGTSYYRLRQVDVDGKSRVFEAKSVVIDGRYGVYPNPVASGEFTLELDEPASAHLHLYNASGIEISTRKSVLNEVSARVSPASKLSSGVYILTVEERGTTRKHRLVVQE